MSLPWESPMFSARHAFRLSLLAVACLGCAQRPTAPPEPAPDAHLFRYRAQDFERRLAPYGYAGGASGVNVTQNAGGDRVFVREPRATGSRVWVLTDGEARPRVEYDPHPAGWVWRDEQGHPVAWT